MPQKATCRLHPPSRFGTDRWQSLRIPQRRGSGPALAASSPLRLSGALAHRRLEDPALASPDQTVPRQETLVGALAGLEGAAAAGAPAGRSLGSYVTIGLVRLRPPSIGCNHDHGDPTIGWIP
jgi:hypothetical protein